MNREPVAVVAVVLTVLGEILVAVRGLGWEEAVLAALPVLAAAIQRYFVRPVPKSQRGFK